MWLLITWLDLNVILVSCTSRCYVLVNLIHDCVPSCCVPWVSSFLAILFLLVCSMAFFEFCSFTCVIFYFSSIWCLVKIFALIIGYKLWIISSSKVHGVHVHCFFLNLPLYRLWFYCGSDLFFIDLPFITLGSYSWLSFFSWILPFLCCDLAFYFFTPIKFPICYVLSLWPCYNIFITTLALGLQPMQRLANVRAKRKLGSHISCS